MTSPDALCENQEAACQDIGDPFPAVEIQVVDVLLDPIPLGPMTYMHINVFICINVYIHMYTYIYVYIYNGEA